MKKMEIKLRVDYLVAIEAVVNIGKSKRRVIY